MAAAGVEQPIFLESGSGILAELRSTVSSVGQQEVNAMSRPEADKERVDGLDCKPQIKTLTRSALIWRKFH